MKVLLILAALVAEGSAAPLPGPGGAEVELMVLAEVSTRDARPGTPVRLRVNKPVTADGVVVIPVGTPAFGVVEAAKGSSIALQRGKLAVRITHLELDGRSIPLSGDVVMKSRGGKGDDVAKILLVPFYAPFAQANSAKLKAGELLTARLQVPAPAIAEATAPPAE